MSEMTSYEHLVMAMLGLESLRDDLDESNREKLGVSVKNIGDAIIKIVNRNAEDWNDLDNTGKEIMDTFGMVMASCDKELPEEEGSEERFGVAFQLLNHHKSNPKG